MKPLASHEQLLRRVRRRWIVWRMIESAAVCAFVGAVIGFLLVPVLIWRGQEALGPALMVLGIGAVAGVVLAVTRTPTVLQTAMEMDRQLGLHDLLGTAIRPQACGDVAFENVVRAQAQAICQGLSGNELMLRRLGGRAWGGMGIAAGLLLTAAMMSSSPTPTQARANDAGKTDGLAASPSAADAHNNQTRSSFRRDRADDAQRIGGDPDPSNDRPLPGGGTASADRSTKPRTDGSGSAEARSDDVRSAPMKPAAADAVRRADRGGGLSGGIVKPPPDRQTPRWRAEAGRADWEAAQRDIDSGRVPDAYRDLVREFFERGEE
jgi:hypothetical protein